ncbi:hypothetical protein EH31_14175 [Erythrobacter longus]|uniref:Uncharacterized protein n=1 Tax=Erythrobacter longus TaxID=1044 RepID=A0A074MUA2_ERYLO|nr:hypothetical protein [Erythrobacter longus]KEO89177.1 hypothetical protein EH31_14175 [Erythrobacter longus]
MKRFGRWIAALIVASIGTYVLAVIANAQFVIGAHNVPVSLSDRLNMTAFDISNMWLYLAVIAAAFLLGFAIAALVKRFVPSLARAAYPIAGAAALGMVLGLMYLQFQTVPISGARSALGFVAQVIAGGIGGWIFAKVLGAPAKPAMA